MKFFSQPKVILQTIYSLLRREEGNKIYIPTFTKKAEDCNPVKWNLAPAAAYS